MELLENSKQTLEQLNRFKKTARELGVDESPQVLDEVFGKLDLKKSADANGKKADE